MRQRLLWYISRVQGKNEAWFVDLRCVSFSWEDNTDNGNDELANAHDNSTPDKETASSELFNHVERGRSSNDIDHVGNDRNQEGVAHADLLKESGSVIDCNVSALL